MTCRMTPALYDTLPPHEAYPGRTRIEITSTRSIICMGGGPDVEAAIQEKAAQIEGKEE